jgi:hypothetical protein
MTVWICPFCKSELIFTGKRNGIGWFGDLGASFYACECGHNIISEAFKNEDGTPKIFYDNKWEHLLNDKWRFYDERDMWGTPKDVPKELKRIKVQFT